ncbi:MAG: CotH kinase family protein [Ardenticatenales bacterium]
MRRHLSFRRSAPAALAVAVAAACAANTTSPSIAATHGAVYLPYAARGDVLHALPPVAFSVERGFFDAPFELTLSQSVASASVWYTLDGSPPAPGHGDVALGPLRIERTTLVRAAAFLEGWLPSPVSTNTYLFLADRIRQGVDAPGFPATWGVYTEGRQKGRSVRADYAVDGRVVDDPRYASEIVDDLKAIPSLSVVTAPDDLFGAERGIYNHPTERGMAWERPASVELVRADGRPGFQVDAGVRIAGGWSRKPDANLKHSLSLRFRSMYGPSKLSYPLFRLPDGAPEGPAEFNSLRLRAGQADTIGYFAGKAQYVHDEWARRTQRDMGWPAARGTWVHLYLDGLYWGLYNLTEELDANFMAAHVGGKESGWDVIRSDDDVHTLDSYDVADGSDADWKTLLAMRAAGGPLDPTTYGRVAQLIDLPQHIDYTLIELYADNWDWPTNNFVAARSRTIGGGFQFFVWDLEHSLGLRQSPGDGYCGPCNDNPGPDSCTARPRQCGHSTETEGVAGLHGWLKRGSAEYRLLFADRVRRQLFEDGALTAAAATERYAATAAEIERAIVGESARWGDGPWQDRTRIENWRFIRPALEENAQSNRPQNRDDHWLPERDRLLTQVFPGRTADLIAQLCAEGLYPPVASLRFTPPGTSLKRIGSVAISPLEQGCAGQAMDGTIWYTFDGTDPRQPYSGNPSSGALPYDRPLRLTGRYVRLRARLRTPDGQWGALAEAVYSQPRVVISELNYHPVAGDAEEFIELSTPLDAATAPLDLGGATFTHGITGTLAAGTRLSTARPIVLARDPLAFAARYGFKPDGTYTGRLADGGERIALVSAAGDVLADISYRDDDLWPLGPDGLGFTLVPRTFAADADLTDPSNWRASRSPGGSPGRDDPAPPWDGRVTLSEILCASAAPYEDAVEFANPSGSPVEIGGWYLSDDRHVLQKYRLPALKMAAGGFGTAFEHDFRALAPPATAFGLGSDGESVYLSSADAAGRMTGFVQRLTCGPADASTSFGPYRHSAGIDVAALVTPTFGVDAPVDLEAFRAGQGAPNAPPIIGPAVVSEVLAVPPRGRTAWVELRNLSDRAIPLGGDPASNTGPWALDGDVRFTFPAGAELPARGFALVLAADPTDRAAAPTVPPDVVLYGPWTGRISAAKGVLALVRPRAGQTADAAAGPWVRVDGVRWDQEAPWAIPTMLIGASLERREPVGWGNDPLSWAALRIGGTPGVAATSIFSRFIPWAQVRR